MDPRNIQALEDVNVKSALHKYFNPKYNPEISQDQPNPVRPFRKVDLSVMRERIRICSSKLWLSSSQNQVWGPTLKLYKSIPTKYPSLFKSYAAETSEIESPKIFPQHPIFTETR